MQSGDWSPFDKRMDDAVAAGNKHSNPLPIGPMNDSCKEGCEIQLKKHSEESAQFRGLALQPRGLSSKPSPEQQTSAVRANKTEKTKKTKKAKLTKTEKLVKTFDRRQRKVCRPEKSSNTVQAGTGTLKTREGYQTSKQRMGRRMGRRA